MAIIIGAGFPLAMLLVMYVFGMYTWRNLGWVLLCLTWGALGYGANYLIHAELLEQGLSRQILSIIFTPLIQQTFVALGVFLVVHWKKFDNLIDGAVYGFTAGLGFATLENIAHALTASGAAIETMVLHFFSTTLVLATASGIVGVVMIQFYFRHRASRVTILLSGLGAATGYTALFNLLISEAIGGDILPVAFGIGGITLVGLYVTGQLRRILIQLAIEKKRVDSLLQIVIPIGVELSTEKNFARLLENMLVEAKKFCNADAGTLYLLKENRLDFAVVRNDSLKIAMGGTSGQEITLPSLNLYNEATGEPDYHHVATYAALTGRSVNIANAYDAEEFDFSGVREFDARTGYKSYSFLTIPLKDSEGQVLGVLQLLNALDARRKEVLPFDRNLQQLMESFSSLACAALEGYIQEQKLRSEIQKLRIEIDAVKRERQVAEITDTEYFRRLQKKAKTLRDRSGPR